jgi:predicted DNA-binding transcriptional regulator YafY
MPKIKTQVKQTAETASSVFKRKPKVKNANDRIKLIDQLLVKYGHINTRERFLKLVNNQLEKQISQSLLDKDLKELRELVLQKNINENTNVELRYSQASGFEYSERGYSYFSNSVNEGDKNLLMLASSLFNVFKGSPLQEKFSAVVNKVLAESLTGGPVHNLTTSDFVQMDASHSPSSTQWIPKILEAIYDQTTLEISYKSFGKQEKKKNICPYVIKQFHGRWFMVAYDHNCERKAKTNTFALDCIKKMEISGYKYIVDPDFSPMDYFRYSIGVYHLHEQEPIQVVLEFSEHIELVQSIPLHHSQKTELSKNGKLLTVTIEVYSTPELEILIQSYGSAVKVVSPLELVNKISESAKKVMQLY